ncbi:23S rRNA (guanosine(2251)-2'-O)-methyltransferase RlmB [Calderihabitans maritimus]|uniref:RNA methyltransferase n=1 Tax=Calderihabitans maritimus TaxID=1246530 RepID=A0A1Z5HP82_9FIRM|nr:23S rRNA (guanosine(2251)-2'-O)-methyltransferase RlmB [Calderihabitans maritimus]GAW91131.1 RNA methyltransferase [Calderihabitans maritimus]
MDGLILGRNAVLEALKAGRPINKILVAEGAKSYAVKEIYELAKRRQIPVQKVRRENLARITETSRHQGIVAYTSPKDYVTVDDILEKAKVKGEAPFIVMLDHIEDPQNLGAVMRTADAVGCHGIIIPKRRSVQLTATVEKVSAGAVEYVPVARVANLPQTAQLLQEKGCWVVGLDAKASQIYYEVDLKGPLVLVIGSEGKGISRLLKEKCDFHVRLPMVGHIDSLNAAVAASIVMYEAARQRWTGI